MCTTLTGTDLHPDFALDLQHSLINMFLTDLLFAIIFRGLCLEGFFFFNVNFVLFCSFLSISLFEEFFEDEKSCVKCDALTLLTLQTNSVKVMKS